MSEARLPFGDGGETLESRIEARDRAGRARAVDPRHNVVLEASAGTGKTRVLVQRYLNLLHAGVDPANVLAITFTRKAAAEMRERIVASLHEAAASGTLPPSRWRELRDRTGEIAVSTIDAFCLSLLREFTLEADLDPGFTVADDTEVPRLVDDALDRALRVCRSVALDDEHVTLVFAQLGERRARAGLAALLARRLVAPALLSGYLSRARASTGVASVAERAARTLLQVFEAPRDAVCDTPDGSISDGLLRFVTSGPADPEFALLVSDLERLSAAGRCGRAADPAHVHAAFARARAYFLTRDGRPRRRLTSPARAFPSREHLRVHRELVAGYAPAVAAASASYTRELNVLVSRGVWRMFRIAEAEYRRTLDAHGTLDFPDLLLRTLHLLRQMDEFARSRYRLESRYHHVLVDEFQDTSRAQWELISLLVQSWGEGAGLAASGPLPPSIFIVGDRKQSIYGFRDADVAVLDEAARFIGGLRPDGDVRRSISRSFRAGPALLSFVNDVGRDLHAAADRTDGFRYTEEDVFPVDPTPWAGRDVLHAIRYESPHDGAEAVGAEIARILADGVTVRDPRSGVPRPARPGDIAILFRARESHREIAGALERRDLPAYVYKGLGFYESDEVRDVLALLWHLAEPRSDLRAAAWLGSGFVRLSDEGLRRLAPHVAAALAHGSRVRLDPPDAEAFELACAASLRWRRFVDRVPAADLLDRALSESAYAVEMKGDRNVQARENLKKLRGLVRRIQNKGYATLWRIVAQLDRLALGDDANAAIDARDSVHLMTVHAAKGLEFPVVFLANLDRGTANRQDPVRVATDGADEVSVSVGDFESLSDEDRAAREREETKRLLYVALTRARDRLYLGVRISNRGVQAGRGSLAEVLPAPLLDALGSTPVRDPVKWRARSGVTHVLAACAPAGGQEPIRSGPEDAPVPRDDFEPLDAHGTPSIVSSAAAAGRSVGEPGGPGPRLRGTLAHRLLARLGLPAESSSLDVPVLAGIAAHCLGPEERDEIDDVPAICAAAARLYAGLVTRPELRELYRSADAFHEVPFCLARGGSVVRGTIDLLVRRADPVSGRARTTVVELKTGRPAAGDAGQARTYAEAVETLFPGEPVETWLLYPDGTIVL